MPSHPGPPHAWPCEHPRHICPAAFPMHHVGAKQSHSLRLAPWLHLPTHKVEPADASALLAVIRAICDSSSALLQEAGPCESVEPPLLQRSIAAATECPQQLTSRSCKNHAPKDSLAYHQCDRRQLRQRQLEPPMGGRPNPHPYVGIPQPPYTRPGTHALGHHTLHQDMLCPSNGPLEIFHLARGERHPTPIRARSPHRAPLFFLARWHQNEWGKILVGCQVQAASLRQASSL